MQQAAQEVKRALLFPGLGPDSVSSGREFLKIFPLFTKHFESLAQHLPASIREVLYDKNSESATESEIASSILYVSSAAYLEVIRARN
ncbi:MAG: hypothetical protein JKX97_02415, partial [Candidatus Lindowbacteria bacterium]|nr:hypothetical protein [Candidatus Lindowbacteria bacterium]